VVHDHRFPHGNAWRSGYSAIYLHGMVPPRAELESLAYLADGAINQSFNTTVVLILIDLVAATNGCLKSDSFAASLVFTCLFGCRLVDEFLFKKFGQCLNGFSRIRTFCLNHQFRPLDGR
jgi:hypothetical protein